MNEARNLRLSQHAQEREKQVWICFEFGKASLTSFIFSPTDVLGVRKQLLLYVLYVHAHVFFFKEVKEMNLNGFLFHCQRLPELLF